MTITLAAAAAARAQQIRQRADRPSQRRSAERAGSLAVARVPATLRLREVDETGQDVTDVEDVPVRLQFTGVATAYERGYEMWDMFGPYTEIVSAGAGAESLIRDDLDVPLVLGHDQLRRIARTTTGSLTLTETEAGLHVLADLDPTDVDVAYIAPKLRAGLVDEMSFAFRITAGQWSPDYTEYRIQRYDIHRGDVAIVGYGANPHTESALRAPSRPTSSRARALLELGIARG